MKPKILTAFSFLFVMIACVYFVFPFNVLKAQTKLQTDDWYKKLLEKNVIYENDACEVTDKTLVKEFFKTRQPKEIFPICHNDCPIVKCRPVIPFPAVAKAVRVSGTISVHVLVDEKGKTIYARVLSGHPLIKESIKKAACETQFRTYENKHQGVMHFLIDSYNEINVPGTANMVSHQ